MNWLKLPGLSFLAISGATLLVEPAPAQITSGGDGTTITQSGNTTTITGGTQAGNNLFHSFGQFNLSSGQTASFTDPGVQNILGRVTGGNASLINGLLQVSGGNANLYLINPAGILFGSGASLNVAGSFTATTASGIGFGDRWLNAIGSNDYTHLSGNPTRFAFPMAQPGAIVNAGNLAVNLGQSITLLGGTVLNTGTLTAPEGSVTLLATPGERLITLSQEGSLLSLALPLESTPGLHTLPFTPLALPQLLTGGNLGNATAVTVENGLVRLTGSGVTLPTAPGTTIVTNQIDVSGATGGTVQLLGRQVGLVSATIGATGTSGGGTVLVGGDYQGQGELPRAEQTYVSRDSLINASALTGGDGGRVIIWADGTTRFYGSIQATGGSQTGNGGLVEVSGRENLTFDGAVNVQAGAGSAGQLLLDPANVTIGNNAADDGQLSDRQILASDGGANFFISVAGLVQALATGNVTIAASSNITIEAEVDARANTNLAALVLTAPQIALNESIRLNNGSITLNGNVNNTVVPANNLNQISTSNGDITINGNVNSPNTRRLVLQTPGTITVTGEIGNTSSLSSLDLRDASVAILENYSGNNRLDIGGVGQLQLRSTGDMTISNNLFPSGVAQIEVNAANNLTITDNSLQAGSNLSLTAGNTLTLDNVFLDSSFSQTNLQIEGSTVNILGSRISRYQNVSIQGQTIDIQSTPANPVNLITQRNLTINAQNSLQVQDGANSVQLQAEGNLTAQGTANLSLQMLNQPQSVLRSGANLTLVSDGTIAANARILSEGSLTFQKTSGAPADLSVANSSSTGIISSLGDVSFGNYQGPSLKIETRGSIQGGNITITGPDTTLQGSDPEIAILSSLSSLILRAGLGELQTSSSSYPNSQQLRNTPTLPPDRALGTTSFTTSGTVSPGRISVGTIEIIDGSSNDQTNFRSGQQVILAASDGITTGDILGGRQSIAVSTTRGDIKTGNLRTDGFSGYNGVFLSAPLGNIEINTIDTGAAGINITAGGTFRAIAAKPEGNYDAFGSGLFNNPDLINYLVSLGYDRQQLLDAVVRLEAPNNFNSQAPLQISLISRPGTAIGDKPLSPITIRYGDQSQVLVDRSTGLGSPASRIMILGDSQQKFRMGPVPKDNIPFIPANPGDLLQDYNPLTNNFRFAFNASLPLTYPSEQFPLGASGLAAGIVVGPGNNSSLYGSAQSRVFDPLLPPPGPPPLPDTSGDPPGNPGNTGNPGTDQPAAPRQQFRDGRVTQQFNQQENAAVCDIASSTTATSIPPGTERSAQPAGGDACNTPRGSADDAQILQLLEGGVK